MAPRLSLESQGCRRGLRLPGTLGGLTGARVIFWWVSVCGSGHREAVADVGLRRCPALLSSISWETAFSYFHKYRSADGRHPAGVPLAAGTAMLHPSLTLRSICTLLCCRLLLEEAVGLMPGLVACRREVILPATLMLPRKPEFSFFSAMVWGRSSRQSGAAPSPGAVRRAGVIRFAPALSFLQENILLFHISPIIPHLLPSSISAMFLPRVSWLSRGVWKGAKWDAAAAPRRAQSL